MANTQHVAVIRKGTAIWNRWRNRHQSTTPELVEVDLRRVELSRANLSKAQLAGATLDEALFLHANFTAANLSNASLRSARLIGADFTGSDLSGADLTGARLSDADLTSACLAGANLTLSDLTGARLFGTDLRAARLDGARLTAADMLRVYVQGASFRGAIFGATSLRRIDLGGAGGLDAAIHRGPSSIDVESLFSSEVLLPETFLHGFGVPASIINALPSLVNRDSIKFASCFISYSHADRIFALRLHDDLQSRGVNCWLDERRLLPGDDIFEEVARGIRLWDRVLLCCSRVSLTSWWVDNEIEMAFEKERELTERFGKKVLVLIPLDLDGYLFDASWVSGKRSQILSRFSAKFTGWSTEPHLFERTLEQLVAALRLNGA